MTLVEMVVAIGVGAIVVTAVVLLYLFGLRSFGAIGNYAELDIQSRMAMDKMLREMRQACGVTGWSTNTSPQWLQFTNSNDNTTFTCYYDTTAGVVYSTKSGQATVTNLTGCFDWSFRLYQRTPNTNVVDDFTILSAQTNVAICKLVEMSWSCQRTNLYRKFNTEAMTTAEVVLRNKP
jgi:Tfp pilus assembly protein PilW